MDLSEQTAENYPALEEYFSSAMGPDNEKYKLAFDLLGLHSNDDESVDLSHATDYILLHSVQAGNAAAKQAARPLQQRKRIQTGPYDKLKDLTGSYNEWVTFMARQVSQLPANDESQPMLHTLKMMNAITDLIMENAISTVSLRKKKKVSNEARTKVMQERAMPMVYTVVKGIRRMVRKKTTNASFDAFVEVCVPFLSGGLFMALSKAGAQLSGLPSSKSVSNKRSRESRAASRSRSVSRSPTPKRSKKDKAAFKKKVEGMMVEAVEDYFDQTPTPQKPHDPERILDKVFKKIRDEGGSTHELAEHKKKLCMNCLIRGKKCVEHSLPTCKKAGRSFYLKCPRCGGADHWLEECTH